MSVTAAGIRPRARPSADEEALEVAREVLARAPARQRSHQPDLSSRDETAVAVHAPFHDQTTGGQGQPSGRAAVGSAQEHAASHPGITQRQGGTDVELALDTRAESASTPGTLQPVMTTVRVDA
ncbi:hypothetical protein [Streptomyces sp. NPDC057740]|uniref:hypothetical protein n=1 Tax=Streptomyces sp. NPDC057740 TaxID=3346234 RepID=UPI00367D73AE